MGGLLQALGEGITPKKSKRAMGFRLNTFHLLCHVCLSVDYRSCGCGCNGESSFDQ